MFDLFYTAFIAGMVLFIFSQQYFSVRVDTNSGSIGSINSYISYFKTPRILTDLDHTPALSVLYTSAIVAVITKSIGLAFNLGFLNVIYQIAKIILIYFLIFTILTRQINWLYAIKFIKKQGFFFKFKQLSYIQQLAVLTTRQTLTNKLEPRISELGNFYLKNQMDKTPVFIAVVLSSILTIIFSLIGQTLPDNKSTELFGVAAFVLAPIVLGIIGIIYQMHEYADSSAAGVILLSITIYIIGMFALIKFTNFVPNKNYKDVIYSEIMLLIIGWPLYKYLAKNW